MIIIASVEVIVIMSTEVVHLVTLGTVQSSLGGGGVEWRRGIRYLCLNMLKRKGRFGRVQHTTTNWFQSDLRFCKHEGSKILRPNDKGGLLDHSLLIKDKTK